MPDAAPTHAIIAAADSLDCWAGTGAGVGPNVSALFASGDLDARDEFTGRMNAAYWEAEVEAGDDWAAICALVNPEAIAATVTYTE